jgi:hypothetical protein
VRPDAPPLPPPLAGDSLLPVVRGGSPLPERDRLLEAVILQDYPHPRRDLYGIDVH